MLKYTVGISLLDGQFFNHLPTYLEYTEEKTMFSNKQNRNAGIGYVNVNKKNLLETVTQCVKWYWSLDSYYYTNVFTFKVNVMNVSVESSCLTIEILRTLMNL